MEHLKGIDTFNAVTYGRFNFNSKLSSEYEARPIVNCPDINAHLTKLCTKNVISEYQDKGKRDFADQFSQSIDDEIYNKGATYVSLENSTILQK